MGLDLVIKKGWVVNGTHAGAPHGALPGGPPAARP